MSEKRVASSTADEIVSDMPAPELSRRRIAAALFGAVGLSALAGCTQSTQAMESTRALSAGLSGPGFQWVDSIAGSTGTTLRSIYGSATSPVVIVGGYAAAGDGGGGIFYWQEVATASLLPSDDHGILIVPPTAAGQPLGYWQRIYSGAVDVRWFGADPSGALDSRAAIQSAFDAAGTSPSPGTSAGAQVVFAPGRYLVVATSAPYALLIANAISVDGGGASLVLQGNADFLLIEDSATTGKAHRTAVRNLTFTSPDANPNTQNGIVVHAAFVIIEQCSVANMGKNGILLESAGGDVPPQGSTAMPPGTILFADCWRLNRIELYSCGAGIKVHGSDSNIGLGMCISSYTCGVGIDDGSSSGATWIATLSESDQVSVHGHSGAGSVFLGSFCDGPMADLNSSYQGALTDGVLGGSLSLFSPKYVRAAKVARTTSTSAQDLNEVAWWLEYERVPTAESTNYYGVQELRHTWAWRQQGFDPSTRIALDQGGANPDVNGYGAPFAWSDSGHPCGAGLPLFGNPLLNSKYRWSHRQEGVVLTPGENVVCLSGTVLEEYCWYAADPGPGGLAMFRLGDSRLHVDLELSADDFATAPRVTVGAHAFAHPAADNGKTRNAAVKIYNDGTTNVTGTIVWHFEMYVRREGETCP